MASSTVTITDILDRDDPHPDAPLFKGRGRTAGVVRYAIASPQEGGEVTAGVAAGAAASTIQPRAGVAHHGAMLC